MKGSGSHYGSSFTTHKTVVPVPAKVTELHLQLDGLEDLSDRLASQLQELRSELHQAASKERQARASLAKQVLSSTPAGATLLKKLTSENI